MQPTETAIAEECWRAAIPVQLRLADSEVSSLEQPPTLYMLVPRQSYLHSLVPQALQLLQHLLPPGEQVPWFEHAHLPLKWSVPAGVLYDVVAAPSGELPWRLTIHFRGFPERMLAAYGGEAALRGSFFNSLKEAAVICRGSAQRVMEMAGGAQEDLWRQVLGSCLQRHSGILASLQLAPAAGRSGPPRVPLRLFVRLGAGGYLSSYEDIVSTSQPVEALTADGSTVTLRQALLPLLRECLPGSGSSARGRTAGAAAGVQSLPGTSLARESSGFEDGTPASASADAEVPAATEEGPGPAEGSSSAAAAAAAAAAAERPTAQQDSSDATGEASAAAAMLEQAAAQRRVLVGGTVPPLDAPLAWLHARLHAADYFLYVVLHVPSSS